MDLDDVIDALERLDDADLRTRTFEIGGTGPEPTACYPYQVDGLRKIEAGQAATPPISGILHYPASASLNMRVGLG